MPTNLQQPDGTLETIDGRDVLRYERHLSHPVERVWRAITAPEEIVQWLGEAELEPVEGGTVVVRWLNMPSDNAVARGTVSAFASPRLLEFDTDIHGILRWELEPEGDGCRLTFVVSIPATPEARLKTLAGWHIHLDHLAEALDGRTQNWSRWTEDQMPRWQEHHDRYAERYSAD